MIKFLINLSFILTLLFALVSCKSDRNNNIRISYYPDGNIKSIKRYLHDTLNGEAIWFYPNGNTEEKGFFKNGKPNGNAYYFYESGALKSFRYWRDGKKVGHAADYHDDTLGIAQAFLFYNDSGQLIYKKDF